MSNRHRSSKQATPGAAMAAPSKEERRATNRKVRRRTHELLAHADVDLGEEIVTPLPVHTRVETEPPEVVDERSPRPRREYRHWKQKFWKRRNNVRAEKAMMVNQEMPVPDLL